jgi:succinate dehydrogenase / fumarate reductase iron-sulfur subunit
VRLVHDAGERPAVPGVQPLVDRLDAGPITLEPLTKFPVVRDLQVDRSPMFDALKKVKAWIPIDGTYDLGFGPKMAEAEREVAYAFSRCMTCGCCMEACPQYNDHSEFIGPARSPRCGCSTPTRPER